MHSAGFRVQGAVRRVQGAGFRVQGAWVAVNLGAVVVSGVDGEVRREVARVKPANLVYGGGVYRGTSRIRNQPTLAPFSRTMPRALWF